VDPAVGCLRAADLRAERLARQRQWNFGDGDATAGARESNWITNVETGVQAGAGSPELRLSGPNSLPSNLM